MIRFLKTKKCKPKIRCNGLSPATSAWIKKKLSMNTTFESTQQNAKPKECCMKGCADCSKQPTSLNTHPLGTIEWPLFWTDPKTWKITLRNTLNCLIGCMIGDIAVLIYMQIYHPDVPMHLTMIYSMISGLFTSVLFESAMLRWRESLDWKSAITTAFSMSFLSMLGMEFASNATDFMLTGGRIPLTDPYYWGSLAFSILIGFLAPLPYNYWKFKKHGKTCH